MSTNTSLLVWIMETSINLKKSFCLRIGPGFNNILVVYQSVPAVCLYHKLMRGAISEFTCSSRVISNVHLMQLNVAFFRSLNAVFGKIGRTASEEVVLEFLKRKCLRILMYGTKACGLSNRPTDKKIFRL